MHVVDEAKHLIKIKGALMIPPYLRDNLNKIKNVRNPDFDIAKPYYSYSSYPVVKSIIEACPNGKINRDQVTEYFKREEYLEGFFAAMIWGGVSTGGLRGDNLTPLLAVKPEKLLTIIENIEGLIVAQNFGAAYQYMQNEGKLKGLGDSFFTKIFFFLGQAKELSLIPPIFDKWTKLAYCALLINNDEQQIMDKFVASINGADVRLRNRYSHLAFEDFVMRMNEWAVDCEVAVSQLECFVFGNDKRYDKSNNNPRCIFENMLIQSCSTKPKREYKSKQLKTKTANTTEMILSGSAEFSALDLHTHHHRETGKPPTQDELLHILVSYFKTASRADVICKQLAYELQDKFEFWNGSRASDKNRAAYDAVAAFCVYGIAEGTQERYASNNARRRKFEEVLGMKLQVSEQDSRTFSLISI